jgi:hypothetical protein
MRWRVWYRQMVTGEVYQAKRLYDTRPQALAAGRLGVMMREAGKFGGKLVQFQVRRRWHRRPQQGKWLP